MPALSLDACRLRLVRIFALIFACFVVYERAGLEIGHFYYLAIALAAIAVAP